MKIPRKFTNPEIDGDPLFNDDEIGPPSAEEIEQMYKAGEFDTYGDGPEDMTTDEAMQSAMEARWHLRHGGSTDASS